MSTTDLWAELPSPVKTDFRDAFRRYALRVYTGSHILLRDYIPAVMGAHMPREDYLLFMPEEKLPACYVATAFSECSSPAFVNRLLNSGIYGPPEPLAFFPEVLVTDLKRLGNRPVPESYEALADPVYRGELCLIGNRGRPDPLLPLYIYNKLGKNAMSSLLRNISTLAAPSTTIRFLGKAQNRYGSVFVMPALFAEICESLPQVMVHYPSSGALAEPILLFWRTDIPPEKKALLSSFFASPESAASFRKVRFPVSRHPAADDIPIDPLCREKLLYRERWDLLL